MDKNTDPNIVVMDATYFARLHSLARIGAAESGQSDVLKTCDRHIRKFNTARAEAFAKEQDEDREARYAARQRVRAILACEAAWFVMGNGSYLRMDRKHMAVRVSSRAFHGISHKPPEQNYTDHPPLARIRLACEFAPGQFELLKEITEGPHRGRWSVGGVNTAGLSSTTAFAWEQAKTAIFDRASKVVKNDKEADRRQNEEAARKAALPDDGEST